MDWPSGIYVDPDYLPGVRLCQRPQGHLDKFNRADLDGLHDMLSYALQHGSGDAKYEIFCDNESVLKFLDPAKKLTIVELFKAEGKLVQQNRDILQKFRNISLYHAKGHQDSDTRYKDLGLQPQLNVD